MWVGYVHVVSSLKLNMGTQLKFQSMCCYKCKSPTEGYTCICVASCDERMHMHVCSSRSDTASGLHA